MPGNLSVQQQARNAFTRQPSDMVDAERQQQTAGLLEEYDDRHDDTTSSNSSATDEVYTEKTWMQSDSLWWRFPHVQDTGLLLKKGAKSIVPTLLPSFLHSVFLRTKSAEDTPLHPTAYLDGLRGVAALIVVVFHLTLDWYPSLGTGYHVNDDRKSWLQLPLIRTFYSGRGMVSIFFVISGYVLSAKSLRLMRTDSSGDTLLSTLSSSVFRRAMRLFFPIIFSSLIAVVLVRYDLFIGDIQGANIIPPQALSLYDQVCHWARSMKQLTNIYDAVGVHNIYPWSYDGHLWTIPVEYRGSIVVFCTLLAVAKARPGWRMTILVASTLYNLWVVSWDLFLFLCGMTIAEIQCCISHPSPSAPSTFINTSSTRTILSKATNTLTRPFVKQLLIFTTFYLGFHILGTPNDYDVQSEYTQPSLGFEWLRPLTPQAYDTSGNGQKFWLAIAAVLIVLPMSFSPTLQRPFTTGLAQYLGYVSYSLYLLHGNVLYTIGMYILRAQIILGMGGLEWEGKPDGKLNVSEGYVSREKFDGGEVTRALVSWEGMGDGYNRAYLCSFLLCGVVLIWASDVFTRVVDGPCVRLSGKIQRWVSGENR